MAKRILGAVLLGIGLLFLAAAVVLSLVVTPAVAKLPGSGEIPTTVLDAPNATFVHTKLVNNAPAFELAHADLRATTTIKPEAEADALPDNAVVWNAAQQVARKDTSEAVSGSQTRIALDRGTGAAADWSGQCLSVQANQPCQPGSVKFTGQLYAFPFNTEKKTYQYWDSTLRKALPIAYEGTDKVEGLATYRFKQTVPDTSLPLDPQLMAGMAAALPPGMPAPTSATLHYTGTRTLWVEPVTGSIIDYEEQQRQTLVLGPSLQVDLFNATFRYTGETRKAVADEAGGGRTMIRTLRWYAPAGLAVLALLALAFGFLLIRRGRPPQAVVAASPDRPGDDADRAPSVV